MRADRLVAILLMLQHKGQVDRGGGGGGARGVGADGASATSRRSGWPASPSSPCRAATVAGAWPADGRTDLSGLSAAEVRALFLVVGPSASATPEVRAALRKLVRALPESFRTQAAAALATVVVDARGWHDSPAGRPVPPFLDAVQRAVIEGNQLALGYVDRDGAATERQVDPLGLAAKGSLWYLVADTEAGQRTFRVDRITAVDLTGRPARRPDDFDLAATWQGHHLRGGPTALPRGGGGHTRSGPARPVSLAVRVAPAHRPIRILGPRGRRDQGRSERSLIGELAGFGAGIEVISPAGIRHGLGRVGQELASLYRGGVHGPERGLTSAPLGEEPGQEAAVGGQEGVGQLLGQGILPDQWIGHQGPDHGRPGSPRGPPRRPAARRPCSGPPGRPSPGRGPAGEADGHPPGRPCRAPRPRRRRAGRAGAPSLRTSTTWTSPVPAWSEAIRRTAASE